MRNALEGGLVMIGGTAAFAAGAALNHQNEVFKSLAEKHPDVLKAIAENDSVIDVLIILGPILFIIGLARIMTKE